MPWRHEPPIAVYGGHGEALHPPLSMRRSASPSPCLHCLPPCVRRSLSHRCQPLCVRPRPHPRTADSDHSNRRYGSIPIPPAFREPSPTCCARRAVQRWGLTFASVSAGQCPCCSVRGARPRPCPPSPRRAHGTPPSSPTARMAVQSAPCRLPSPPPRSSGRRRPCP